MKLYTEDDMLNAMNTFKKSGLYEKSTDVLKIFTPIELPNIKDINEKSKSIWFGSNYFKEGAKYVLDKIKKQQ